MSTIPTPTVSTDGTWSADAATAFTRSVFLIRTPSRGSRVECKEIVTGVRGRMLIAVRPRIRRVPRRRAATPAVATGCERGHSVSAHCKEIHKWMKCTEERNREFYTETLSRSWAIILNFENGEKTSLFLIGTRSSRCGIHGGANAFGAVWDVPVWDVLRVYGAFPAHERHSSLSLLWPQLRWVGQPHATKNRHNGDARRARSVEVGARALGFEPRAPSGPAPEDCRLLGPLCSAYCNYRL